MNTSLDGVAVLRDVDVLAASLGGQALRLAGAGDVVGVPHRTAAALELDGPTAPWGSQHLVLLSPDAAAVAWRAHQIAHAHAAAAAAVELQALAATRRQEARALENEGPDRDQFAGAEGTARLLRSSARGLDLQAAAHRQTAREVALASGIELDEHKLDALPF